MLYPGLCSVTFARRCDAETVLRHAEPTALESIEWGDKPRHVPAGDLNRAEQVGRQTREAGLSVAAYGSYYRLASDSEQAPFAAVLDTAMALGAPTVRVWAGEHSSDDADAQERQRVADDAHRIAQQALEAGIQVALEYHGGTLTDTNDSALALLRNIDHKNLKTYWQPPQCTSHAYRLEGLRAVLPWLSNVHVFHWTGSFWPEHRPTPLIEGAKTWLQYLDLAASDGDDRHALLEFIPGDDPAGLAAEARTLSDWTGQINDALNEQDRRKSASPISSETTQP